MKLSYPVLTSLIIFPLIGAILIFFSNKTKEFIIKLLALVITIITFLLCLPVYFCFDKKHVGMQFVEKVDWIKDWNISYHVGVDGISVLMVILAALISVLCVIVSWHSIKHRVKEYYINLLLTEGLMIGVFCALDVVLFYFLWEAMLIPMFLIIGVWGGPRRIYSAIKFFLYTLVGSLLMLVGIVVLYREGSTFNLIDLMNLKLSYGTQLLLFWAFFAAFAVKVPMIIVHTWLPDAHTEAPTAGSVFLAAILIKMGAYGFLRFSLSLFPDATIAMAPVMLVLSIIAIVYGGLICLVQTDIKRLIAYSSVSHMGFVTLGIFSLNTYGIEGGILQMINHGVITGGLFLCIGIVYERTHSRIISDYGGLANVMPVYAAFFLIFTLASIGLPGTNGFIGEFLSILGGFKASTFAGVIAATGIIIGAVYMLWLYQRVFFMGKNEKISALVDINATEIVTLLPLIIIVLWIGFFPNSFLSFMDATVNDLVDKLQKRVGSNGFDSLKGTTEIFAYIKSLV
ncbi:MAG: NADH-quinone oxidoreductase subunit M [Candidatus Magnetoovum sp. WYHC-5]|nr:NADH-quinone oxidoreductase subunit M [Candidatus Magnetoovum sp. WYHC-5]